MLCEAVINGGISRLGQCIARMRLLVMPTTLSFSPSISSSGCFLSVNFGFKISQLESIDDGEFHIAMFFRMPHFLLACRIRCRYFITL